MYSRILISCLCTTWYPISIAKSLVCSCVSSLCECPHFYFCLHQNQLMAQHGSRIAWTQHCCQWVCKAAHSDPFVSGQNAGEPGTKRARHCRSVLVQRGIKYLQSALHLHLRLCVLARNHSRKQLDNKLNTFCVFPLVWVDHNFYFLCLWIYVHSWLTWPAGTHEDSVHHDMNFYGVMLIGVVLYLNWMN